MELESSSGKETQVHKWAYANSVFKKNQICLAPFDMRSALLDSLKCGKKR